MSADNDISRIAVIYEHVGMKSYYHCNANSSRDETNLNKKFLLELLDDTIKSPGINIKSSRSTQ
jgi:hypothetical protein